MRAFTRLLMFAAQLFISALALLAQTMVDPSGHWEGKIQTPNADVTVEIDLARNSKGALAGTFSQPADGVKGLPLTTVTVEGRSVRLLLKPGTGGGTFNGILTADGKSLGGEFITAEGGYSIPFNLTRTGDARITPTPKSAPIGKEMEGTWNGALDAGGRQMRIVLKMANQPDGTATGTILSVDGSGVEIPVAMTQMTANLTVDVTTVGATFVGVLNTEGTELAGTWTQQGAVLPLTFRKEVS